VLYGRRSGPKPPTESLEPLIADFFNDIGH
jgi:hypothetical protein